MNRLMKLLPYILWATAIVRVTDDPGVTAGVLQWRLSVSYIGVDVTGGSTSSSLVVSTNPVNAAGLASVIVSAVQSDATGKGFTVPAGNTYLPSYSKL